MSVEHPCIVKNVDKGIKSLGGEVKLSKFLGLKDYTKTIGASLRPDDALAKPVMSNTVKTSNLLLKVTVPKRTGRKRKRGSNGPFLSASEVQQNGNAIERIASNTNGPFVEPKTVLRSLRDNAAKYCVEPFGVVQETHRFRSLPDFQYSTARNPLMNTIRECMVPLEYEKLKAFKPNIPSGIHLYPDIGPPALFSQSTMPLNYAYRQNTGVRFTTDVSGQVQIANLLPKTPNGHFVEFDVESVPASLTLPLPPEDTLRPDIQATIRDIRAEFEKRPIMTRRVLLNLLGRDRFEKIRLAYGYVAYGFNSGPWRDCFIKFGVDPRSDPECRHYQSMMFQTFRREKNDTNAYVRPRLWTQQESAAGGAENITAGGRGHIFDGQTVSPDGKVWQACDVTDPMIRQVLDITDIRTTCDVRAHGWYHAGTWAKARVIMRDKITTILEGGTPDNSIYQRILKWPEIITDDNIWETREVQLRRDLDITPKEYRIMAQVRDLARQPAHMTSRVATGKRRYGTRVSKEEAAELMAMGEVDAFEELENDLDWSEEDGFFDDDDGDQGGQGIEGDCGGTEADGPAEDGPESPAENVTGNDVQHAAGGGEDAMDIS